MKYILVSSAMIMLILASCAGNGGIMTEDFPEPDKLCALTFDDGPDNVLTARVLDKLEAHDVTASFFVIGQRINGSTAGVMRRAVEMGCEIHNHAWGYESLTGKNAQEIRESITRTTIAIEEHANVSPAFFRPPNLAVNALMHETIDLPFASGVLGMDWTGGGGDTARKIASNVLSGINDGAIILLHDVQPEPHHTAAALDILIPELKRRGYEFVGLSELFERKGIDPASRPNQMWTIVR